MADLKNVLTGNGGWSGASGSRIVEPGSKTKRLALAYARLLAVINLKMQILVLFPCLRRLFKLRGTNQGPFNTPLQGGLSVWVFI